MLSLLSYARDLIRYCPTVIVVVTFVHLLPIVLTLVTGYYICVFNKLDRWVIRRT